VCGVWLVIKLAPVLLQGFQTSHNN